MFLHKSIAIFQFPRVFFFFIQLDSLHKKQSHYREVLSIDADAQILFMFVSLSVLEWNEFHFFFVSIRSEMITKNL